MSLAKIMNRMLCPYGLRVHAVQIKEAEELSESCEIDITESEYQTYELNMSGRIKDNKVRTCMTRISIPVISPNGTYVVDGVTRAIANKAYIDYTMPIDSGRHFLFDSKVQVLMSALNKMLTRALSDFFYTGNEVQVDVAQHLVDTWFKTSNYCQYIPDNPIAMSSIPELVYFSKTLIKNLDIEERKFSESLIGIIDPCSTSTSDNINLSYRSIKGTKIVQHRLCSSKEFIFCSAIEDNAIGIEYNPKRIHMLRPQFEQSLEMKHAEEPLVKPRNNKLSGKHLRTAIMYYKDYNFEDAICFSESAAKKMTCIRKYGISTATASAVNILVKEGESINKDTPLISYVESVTGKQKTSYCPKLFDTGIVESIRAYTTKRYSVSAIRYKIVIRAEYQLMPGDKVTTRGAIKGVATILPDREMPMLADGTRIECIISPESVYNRQSMVTFWEMMANKAALSRKEPIISRPFDEELSFNDLVNNGYGDKTQLSVKNKMLEEKTFIAPLFMLRLDKIAHEVVSYQDGKTYLNQQGLPIDKASESGQRRDLAMSMNMEAKGLSQILRAFTEDARGVHYKVRELTDIVRRPHGQSSTATHNASGAEITNPTIL